MLESPSSLPPAQAWLYLPTLPHMLRGQMSEVPRLIVMIMSVREWRGGGLGGGERESVCWREGMSFEGGVLSVGRGWGPFSGGRRGMVIVVVWVCVCVWVQGVWSTENVMSYFL